MITVKMSIKLFKIFFLWGVILLAAGVTFSLVLSTTLATWFGSTLGTFISIILYMIFAFIVGYRAVKSTLHIKGIEKISTPFWSGMWVGLIAMLLDTIINYFVFGNFSFGQGILVATAAGFGGKMAGK